VIPDYHFLFVPPVLSADWLFEAARRYWDRFRPMVIHDLEVVGFAPKGKKVAITVIARRDLAPSLIAEVKKRFPSAYLDPLVYDVVRDMRLTLDGRANYGQRFGLPETNEGN